MKSILNFIVSSHVSVPILFHSLLSKRSVKKQRGAIFSCKFSTRSLFLMPIQYKAKKAKQIDGIMGREFVNFPLFFSTPVKVNVFTRNRGATKKEV